jgi:hypothetical protein
MPDVVRDTSQSMRRRYKVEERKTREREPWAYGGVSTNVMSGSPAPS